MAGASLLINNMNSKFSNIGDFVNNIGSFTRNFLTRPALIGHQPMNAARNSFGDSAALGLLSPSAETQKQSQTFEQSKRA